jgi:SAM-dependent methyltransferase
VTDIEDDNDDGSAGRIAAARSMHTPDDAVQLYRGWAADYDHDVFEVMGFTGTDRIADLLAQHLPDRSAAVIDLGCGTGAAGVRLAEHGFTTIDGADISPEMLAVAGERDVYRHLVVVDLTEPLDIAHRYGAAVSAGTFTTGHVGAQAIGPIVGLLQPGAVVAWVIAEPVWPAFRTAMSEAGLRLLHAQLEPIRRDGPPEAFMVVAQLDPMIARG